MEHPMRWTCQLLPVASVLMAPTLALAHNELMRSPRGLDTLLPVATPGPTPAAPPQTITIFTATALAQAVAVMDGKILATGTLDEVRGWVTNQEVDIDRRFENAVIVPGFIEAHMHPQITGVLWQGVYVGRFDRTSPEGAPNKGL